MPGDDVLSITGGSLTIIAALVLHSLGLGGSGSPFANAAVSLTGEGSFSGSANLAGAGPVTVPIGATLEITSSDPNLSTELVNAGLITNGNAYLDLDSPAAKLRIVSAACSSRRRRGAAIRFARSIIRSVPSWKRAASSATPRRTARISRSGRRYPSAISAPSPPRTASFISRAARATRSERTHGGNVGSGKRRHAESRQHLRPRDQRGEHHRTRQWQFHRPRLDRDEQRFARAARRCGPHDECARFHKQRRAHALRGLGAYCAGNLHPDSIREHHLPDRRAPGQARGDRRGDARGHGEFHDRRRLRAHGERSHHHRELRFAHRHQPWPHADLRSCRGRDFLHLKLARLRRRPCDANRLDTARHECGRGHFHFVHGEKREHQFLDDVEVDRRDLSIARRQTRRQRHPAHARESQGRGRRGRDLHGKRHRAADRRDPRELPHPRHRRQPGPRGRSRPR